MSAYDADRRELRRTLLEGLLGEYGEEADTWTALHSLDRIVDAVLAAGYRRAA